MSIDYTVKLWDAATGRRKWSARRDHKPVAVAFSPDGQTLAVGFHGDMSVDLLDPATGRPSVRWTDPGGGVRLGGTLSHRSVVFSPDGRTLATGGDDDVVRLWDTGTETVRQTLRGDMYDLNSVAFTHDGRTLAAGGGRVRGQDQAMGRGHRR